MIPSVGRIVHYVSRGSADSVYSKTCRAAVITEVVNLDRRDAVSLCVLNPTGIFFHEDCKYAEESEYPEALTPGTWHWPERVE